MEKSITIKCDVGEVSDGYHTFNELYAHRCTLFAALAISNKHISWKSKFHFDGSNYDGWFIGGMGLPSGDITYHIPDNFWNLLDNIQELEKGKEWDGHNSNDVLMRLNSWLTTLTVKIGRAHV